MKKRICRSVAKRLGRRIATTAREVVDLGGSEALMIPFRVSELDARVTRWENQLALLAKRRSA